MGCGPLTPVFQMRAQSVVSSNVCFASREGEDEYIDGSFPKAPDTTYTVLPAQKGPQRRCSDAEMALVLARVATITEAARILHYSKSVISTRIRCAADGSSLAQFKGKFKIGKPVRNIDARTKRMSDEVLAAGLATATTLQSAAEALGVSQQSICQRLAHARETSALALYKDKFIKKRREKPHPLEITTNICASNEEREAAFSTASPVSETVRCLEISCATIQQRSDETPEDSSLEMCKGKFEPGGSAGERSPLSNEAFAAALANAPSISAAARSLGVSPNTIWRRIKEAPDDSLLAKYKGAFKRGRRQGLCQTWDEARIAAVLSEASSISEAARRLKISYSTIWLRIKNAPEDSPLAAFKGIFTRGSGPHEKKWSDEEIDAALSNAVSINQAARDAGIPPTTIWQRIIHAPEGSLLAAHKGKFKKTGPPPRARKWSDEELAAILSNVTTLAEAEQRFGISHSTIWKRVVRAPDDSPLAAFKDRYQKSGRRSRKIDGGNA